MKNVLKFAEVTFKGSAGLFRVYFCGVMFTIAPQFKTALSALGGWLWALYAPVFPYAGVCVFLVLVNGWTSWTLRRRLRRRGRGASRVAKFSSAGLGRLVATVTRVNVGLLAASLVQGVILEGTEMLPVDLLKLTAALICFWQLLSILENEATASGAAWARIARRYLADKASRRLRESGD